MSVLNITPIDPAILAANQVRRIAQQMYVQLARSGLVGFNVIWNNSKASPDQIIAALGTDAETIFGLANLNIQTVSAASTLGGAQAPTIPNIPTGYTLTFNEDGSGNLVSPVSPPASN